MGPLSRWAGRTAAAALLLAALGCASTPGARVVHPVKPGETVYRIARYYGVSVRDVVRANKLVRALRPEPHMASTTTFNSPSEILSRSTSVVRCS